VVQTGGLYYVVSMALRGTNRWHVVGGKYGSTWYQQVTCNKW
jgi:hypothetical protein